MDAREEAGSYYSGGSRVGLADGLVSALLTKPRPTLSEWSPEIDIRLISLAAGVRGGVTWRKRFTSHTDEVLRRLGPAADWVKLIYKEIRNDESTRRQREGWPFPPRS